MQRTINGNRDIQEKGLLSKFHLIRTLNLKVTRILLQEKSAKYFLSLGNSLSILLQTIWNLEPKSKN